jgi:undecaprenyl-diphosphatase
MTPLLALLLGIIEGLTEYLPVSSTGHLVLASAAFGLTDDGSKAFDVVVQLGAILAVVLHYRALLWARARGLLAGEAVARRLLVCLIVGFVPSAVLGLLFSKIIKRHLFAPLPIAAALFVGGVVMVGVERYFRGREEKVIVLDEVTPRHALVIGLGQCFALIPGTSRSMSTIVAARLAGLSPAVAAEFSFLLALPTLTAATLYEFAKSYHSFAGAGALVPLLVGLVASFFTAWIVVATFLRVLQRVGLAPFGVYRMLLAVAVVCFALRAT